MPSAGSKGWAPGGPVGARGANRYDPEKAREDLLALERREIEKSAPPQDVSRAEERAPLSDLGPVAAMVTATLTTPIKSSA